MKISNIKIDSPVLLAPMAGFTGLPYRKICKEMGAGVVYSEFVSSEGLIRKSEKTKFYLNHEKSESPYGIQIFGHDPQAMADSARYIEEKFHPDIIDINFGCSVRKVVKKNAGSALLKDLKLSEKIVKQVVTGVSTPVTGKIRIGWDHTNYVGIEVSKILEDNGIAAITVHPRTASDGFRNTIKMHLITKIKKTVNIPVIGNGDILSAHDAQNMLDITGCDAVMVGRGAIQNPWLIKNIINHLRGRKILQPSILDKVNLCLRQLEMERNHRGDKQANKIMRKFYGSYFKGFEGASWLRHNLVTSKDIEHTFLLLKNFKDKIA